jgi:predicted MFS family arabinose efflux permease
MAPMGLAFGSLLGGIVVNKFSLKNLMLLSNLLGILSNLIKIQESTPTVLLGRLFSGVSGGLMNFCFGKALNETVP